MKEEDPETLERLESERDSARAQTRAATPTAPKDAGEKPAWVSQYQWDRFSNGTLAGVNPTRVMRKHADQYHALGPEGQVFLQEAFHAAFDQKLSHSMSNGATRQDAVRTIKSGACGSG